MPKSVAVIGASTDPFKWGYMLLNAVKQSGFEGPIVLIAGGQSKGADFAPLAASARGKLRGAVLIGEAAERLEALLSEFCPTRIAADLPAAVAFAWEFSSAGTTILLSPACASLDMFDDYTVRGDTFVAAVEDLPR